MAEAPTEITDFSGGRTDTVMDAAPNKFETGDNLLITTNKKLQTRPGSQILVSANPRPSSNRTGTLINYNKDDTLLAHSVNDVFAQIGTNWTQILGPTGNSVFTAGSAANQASYAEWRKQLFLTNDGGSSVQIVYRDQSSSFKAVNAGLPGIAISPNYVSSTALSSCLTLANDLRTNILGHFEGNFASAMTLANDLKSKFNAHIIDLTRHSVADSGDTITAANATNLSSLITLTLQLLSFWNVHVYDAFGADSFHYVGYSDPDPSTAVYYDRIFQGTFRVGVQTNEAGYWTPPVNDLATAINALVLLKSYFNNHDADSSVHHGSTNHQSTALGNYQGFHQLSDTGSSGMITAPSATDLTSLITLTSQLLLAYETHERDGQKSVPTIHTVPPSIGSARVSSSILLSNAAPVTLDDIASRLNDLRLKYNAHLLNVDIHAAWGDAGNTETLSALSGINSGPQAIINYQPLYDLANKLKAAFNSHISNAGSGNNFSHVTADTADHVSSADATTPDTLRDLVTDLRTKYSFHEKDAEKNSLWAYHAAKNTSNHPLTYPSNPRTGYTYTNSTLPPFTDLNGGSPSDDYVTQATYLNDVLLQYNAHQADSGSHKDTALITQGASRANVGAITFGSYLLAFHYTYQYQAEGGLTYEFDGPTYVAQFSNLVSLDVQNLLIQNIPVLSSSSNNYDTSKIQIKIFRSINGGTTLFQTGIISNGTTSFTDTTGDTRLITQSEIYTTGTGIDRDPPPQCKALHIYSDTGYYANIVDSGAPFPRRLRQSIPGILSASPGSFFDDYDDDLIGVSSCNSRVIVFGNKYVYRILSTFDELGRGALTHEKISSTTGCVSQNSIVQVEGGIVFCGIDGFYYTDGYSVTKISVDQNPTYQKLISNASHITGTYEKANHRVWWGVQQDGTQSDNDSCFVLDLRFGARADASFTTVSGGSSFSPTALTFFNQNLIRGDKRGYVFNHLSSLTTDPKIDPNTNILTSSTTVAILHRYKSIPMNFGTSIMRKYATRIKTVFDALGPLSVQINAYNDRKTTPKVLTPVRSRIASSGGLIESMRHFPAGGLRFIFKSIEFTNAYCDILNSDTLGLSDISSGSGSNRTALLQSGIWPGDNLDYYLSLQTGTGAYTADLLITAQSGNTITFQDPSSLAPIGTGKKWIVKGYPKGEVMNLVAFDMAPTLLTYEQAGYAPSQAGGNA